MPGPFGDDPPCICGHPRGYHDGSNVDGICRSPYCSCTEFKAAALKEPALKMMTAAQGCADAGVTAMKVDLADRDLTSEEQLQAFVVAAQSIAAAATEGWNQHMAAKVLIKARMQSSQN